MSIKRIKLTVAYDGTHYCGWQIQPNGITIQGVLNDALTDLLGEKIEIMGASRTDAGVHALGQVANFKTNSNIPIEKMSIAINCNLKKSIRIVKAEEVEERFHSRLSCKRKTYRYIINNSEIPSAIYRNLETHIPYKLDIEKIKECNGISEDKIKKIPLPIVKKIKLVGDNLEFTTTMPRIKLDIPKRQKSMGFINIGTILLLIAVVVCFILGNR